MPNLPPLPDLPLETWLTGALGLAGLLAFLLLIALVGLRRRKVAIRALQEIAARQRADLAAAQAHSERLPQLETEISALRRDRDAEHEGRIMLQAQLDSAQAQQRARQEELTLARQELEDRFAALAGQVLTRNSETFLTQVSERFKTHATQSQEDLAKRQQAIEAMVKPLGERLGAFDQKISDIEKARNEAYGLIKAQVQHLAQGQISLEGETRKLVQALRQPKTRGRWGEMQLRQVFEMAGMAENVDFTLEHHVDTDAGAKRPDAVVRIPGGRNIVVDAKTPLEAYLDALESETPDQQTAHLTRHARHIRDHVKILASKSYQSALEQSPDFVVMFIPGENFVASAAEVDPGLIEYAFDNKVLIVTPTTLMALVKAIAYGWQQEKMAENAVEVQKLARDLYDRLGTFGGHLAKVGTALNRSVESYNRAVGSLETRVLSSARKFEALGVVSEQTSIDAPQPVDEDTRPLTAPELISQTPAAE
ncbi:MAG: DNA recombination protein RmuC [Rhodobacteraceae bacterium]|nr:DNA recombination protein RmuC [Paracoccaceae bacterium]